MILFRNPTSATQAAPPWLEGCAEVQCLTAEGATVFAACDPLYLSAPVERAWRPLEDGWQVALVGVAESERLVRRRKDLEYASVEDSSGQGWLVPAVLTPDGDVALTLPWGLQEGIRARKPTEEQRRLIAAAQAARVEILAGRIGETPIDIAAEWVHALLASAYHLPGTAFDALELIDDRLALRVMLAAAGFPVTA